MKYISLSNSGDFIKSPLSYNPAKSLFSDGEISLDFHGYNFLNEPIVLIQSLFGDSSNLLELLFAIDVINRNTSFKPHILLPYISYSRQDREISQFSPISAKVIAKIISMQEISSVSIVDLHSPQIQGFFEKPCFNILLEDFFLKHIMQYYDIKNVAIVSADIGGAKTARKIAEKLGCVSAIVEKCRPKAGVSYAMSLVGDVSGKICIIIDDIIDSAGTLCNAGDMLMQNGALSVLAYASHGIFSGSAFDKIENSAIQKVFVANTIIQNAFGKVNVLDSSSFILKKFEEKVKNF